MVEPYKPLYTIKEAADVLCTSKDTVYALTRSGELPSLTLRSKKIRGSDLERFIENHPIDSPEGAQA